MKRRKFELKCTENHVLKNNPINLLTNSNPNLITKVLFNLRTVPLEIMQDPTLMSAFLHLDSQATCNDNTSSIYFFSIRMASPISIDPKVLVYFKSLTFVILIYQKVTKCYWKYYLSASL